MKAAAGLWVYLSATPLLWLTLTLAAYAIADGIAHAFKRHPLANQVIIAMVLVILTGVLGAIMVTPLMDALKVRDYAARGFAVGVASHGIGTARAFQVNDLAGTFSGLAMGLNGILTAILVPLLAGLFGG